MAIKMTEKIALHWSRELLDVLYFHEKFKIPIGNVPQFLSKEDMLYRLCFLSEELNETMRAYAHDDLEEFFDGLIDLVYVVLGTAVWCGLPWKLGWNAVHEANMKKIRVTRMEDSKRKHRHDIVKPIGWEKPNLKAVLLEAGWKPKEI